MVDHTGKTFARLTVLRSVSPMNGRSRMVCRCICGTVKEFWTENVVQAKTKSCGCFRVEDSTERIRCYSTKHGMHKHELYSTWAGMKSRCCSPTNKDYPYYGGRGIVMCKRWQRSFPAFVQDMGPRPSKKHTIDRKKNWRGYYPANCRWATKKEQASNRRPPCPKGQGPRNPKNRS